MKRLAPALALPALVAVLLAGCGGGGADDGATSNQRQANDPSTA